ncbi:hypothetical protein HQ520_13615, partial [bacterium]|nr:hypothetical protein [bacterium]
RRVLFHLVIFFLIVVALAVAIILVPVRSDFLNRQIAAAFQQATGLRISFRWAVYRLAQGRIDFTDVRFEMPDSGRRLVDVSRVEATWDWRLLRPLTPMSLRSIDLYTPEPLFCYLEDDLTLRPHPRLQSFLDLAEELQRAPRGEVELDRPVRVSLTECSFYLIRALDQDAPATSSLGQTVSALPPGTTPVAGLESTDLAMSYDGKTVWPLQISGYLWGEPSSAVTASLRESGEPGQYVFSMHVIALDLPGHVRLNLPIEFQSRRLTIHGTLDPGPQTRLNLSLEAEEVQAAWVDRGLTLPATALRLEGRGILHHGRKVLEFPEVIVHGWNSDLTASAEVGFNGTRPFRLRVIESHLSPSLINPWKIFLPPIPPRFDVTEGQIRFEGSLSGEETGPDWPRAQGSIRLEKVYLQTDLHEATTRLGPLEGGLTLTSASLELENLVVQDLSSRLAASGRLLRTSEDPVPLRLSWNLEMDAENILSLLPEAARRRIDTWEPRGRLYGSGSLRGPIPRDLPDRLTGAAPPSLRQILSDVLAGLTVDGFLKLEQASLNHPILPAPITDLSGTLILDREVMQLSDVQGTLLKSTVSVSGQISGETFFWREPQIRLFVGGNLDLSESPEMASPSLVRREHRAQIAALEPVGRLDVDLQVAGPPLQPRKLTVTGSVSASDTGLSVGFRENPHRIQHVNGILRLALPESVQFENLSAQVLQSHFNLNGSLSNQAWDLHLETNGDLKDYEKLVPPLFSWFYVDGPINLSLVSQARLREAVQPRPASLQGFFELLSDEFGKVSSPLDQLAILERLLDWDLNGTLESEDCTFTHKFMPADITGVTGRFLLERMVLRTPAPIHCNWGSSPSLTEGTVEFTPEGKMQIVFSSNMSDAIVDEWVRPWGPRDPNSPGAVAMREAWASRTVPEFDPAKRREFPIVVSIDGTVKAPTGLFRKLQLADLDAHFEYLEYPEHRSFIEFDRLRAQAYGGTVSLNPWLFIHGPWFRWAMEMDGRDLQLETLLSDMYGKDSTMNGRLSTTCSFRGLEMAEPTLTGSGSFRIRDSRFLGNPLFSRLGKLINSQMLEDISFAQVYGRFLLQNRQVEIPELELQGAIMELEAQGQATLGGDLDLTVTYNFLSFIPKFPILSQISKTVEWMTSNIVKARITGTIQDPKIALVLLSTDKILPNRTRDLEPPVPEVPPTP